MKARYRVVSYTKKGRLFVFNVNRLKTAVKIMNLPFWGYAKIHSRGLDNRCIDYVRRSKEI